MNRMASNFPISIFSIFFIFSITKTSAWAPAQSPDPNTHLENSTQFIRTRCQSTLYPDLCFSSLSGRAISIHQNPIMLARVAAKLSLSQIHSTMSHISHYNAKHSIAALQDCVDSLASAADQTRRSVTEIGKLDGRGKAGPEAAWSVSNVQTWMSAALTDEETCTDGFEEDGNDDGGDGRVKDDVFRRVGYAKMYTSNGLALVNCLVNGS